MDADFGRRLARRTLAVGSCLLFALPALAAQGTGSVRGRVTAELSRNELSIPRLTALAAGAERPPTLAKH